VAISYQNNAKAGIVKIVLIYLFFSIVWVCFSDMLVLMVTQNPAVITKIAIAKGVLFIVITAILLLSLLTKYAEELVASYDDLELRNQRYNRALMVANQGFFELNFKTGEAIVSRCYWTMLGYNAGKHSATLDWWHESLHPDDRDHAVSVLQQCRDGNESEYRICYRIKTREGEWKWIESAGQVVQYDMDGKPLTLIGMHSDIDDRMKAQ
jgi:PAS domain S-box-containing protein